MRFFTTLLLLILMTGCLLAQEVSNVRVVQRTDGTFTVDIWYDLALNDASHTLIDVQASDDNGVTWDLGCASLTGDEGMVYTAGTDKHIEWDFYADHPNTSGSQFKIRILYYLFGYMTGNDGTSYLTIKIGNQWWMAENLKETLYRDKSPIVEETDGTQWLWAGQRGDARRCVYDNNENNAATYGYLYNWDVVNPNNSQKIAPAGWHVPTDSEWKILERTLGMSESESNGIDFRGTNEGSKLAGQGYLWKTGTLRNDSDFGASLFSALPGGLRGSLNEQVYFDDKGDGAYFWTSSLETYIYAWARNILYYHSDIYRRYTSMTGGYSIRLVKD